VDLRGSPFHIFWFKIEKCSWKFVDDYELRLTDEMKISRQNVCGIPHVVQKQTFPAKHDEKTVNVFMFSLL
jgi:hypothetical protein